MKARLISTVLILPVLMGIMVVGGNLLYLTLCLATLIGFFEFFQATKMTEKSYHYVLGLYVVLTYVMYWQGTGYHRTTLNILLVIIMLVLYAFKYPKIQLKDLGYSFFAIFYILFLLLTIAYVRDHDYYGQWLIWLIFVIAFCSDSGAYIIGVNFGKRKLVPKLSPKKTIEGVFGGFLGGGLGALVLGIIMYLWGPFDTIYQLGVLVVVGVFGSAISQIGDLVGSAMKRQTGIKDFGELIPGHGGILDRLDSILITAGYIYVVQMILSKMVM